MLRFLLFISTIAALTAQASTHQSKYPLSRSEAIGLALHQNYDLRAARQAIEHAKASSIDAGLLPNPDIGVSGNSDFAFRDEGEYSWSASLAQKFPVTARLRLERSLASEEIKLALVEVSAAELRLEREVSILYDQWESNRAKVTLLKEQRRLNQTFRDFLKTKVKRAEASSLDVRQAQLEGAALEQQLGRLERESISLLHNLKQLCGLVSEHSLELEAELRSYPKSLPAYEREAAMQHPEYLLKEQLLTIASRKTDLARANRWDDLAVQVFYEEGYGKDEPVGYEREHMLGMSISMPIPLFNRNRGSIKSARAYEHQLSTQVEAAAFELLTNAGSLRLRYQDIQRQIDLYESELIQLSKSNLTELQNAYASGLINLTDVFRAQERELEIRLAFLELKSERASILSEWHYNTAQF